MFVQNVRNTSYCRNPKQGSALTENKAVHLCREDGGSRFLRNISVDLLAMMA